MGWNNVEVKVETIIDDNPGLYIQRIEKYMELRDYDNALRECESFKRVGGQEVVYSRYVKWISALKSGKSLEGTVVENKLIRIISNILAVSPQFMNLSTRLSDLGADALDAFEIIMGIEDEFNVEMSMLDTEKVKDWTLQQCIIYIAQNR